MMTARSFCCKVALQKILRSPGFFISLGKPVRTSSARFHKIAFSHRTSYRTQGSLYSLLSQCNQHSVCPVVVIVRVLIQNTMYLYEQILPLFRPLSVTQPFVITFFIDRKRLAHSVHMIFFSVVKYEPVNASYRYYFRSFTKKRKASLRMLLASRSSAFSFISFFSRSVGGASSDVFCLKIRSRL